MMKEIEVKFRAGDEIITIYRKGRNDYAALYQEADHLDKAGIIIRGTLAEIMNDIFSAYEEIEEVEED